jgi:hypothetical protein
MPRPVGKSSHSTNGIAAVGICKIVNRDIALGIAVITALYGAFGLFLLFLGAPIGMIDTLVQLAGAQDSSAQTAYRDAIAVGELG